MGTGGVGYSQERRRLPAVVASGPMDPRARIQAELRYARAAREHGKEGRARVCARRAAGWAVAARYPDRPEKSALNLLRWLAAAGPAELREPAGRLLVGVNVDHQLPHPQDPLEDAESIIGSLIGAESTA